jgi:nucleoside-diphosphate-sugar epimerase
MNVLVTGGTGFLGGYVVAALRRAGHEPVAFDLAPPGPEMLAVAPDLAERFREGSTAEAACVLEICRSERIDAIVHAAARLGQAPSLQDPVGFYQTNVVGSLNVFEAARALGIKKLVSISSNAVYHSPRGERFTEDDRVFSISHATPAAHYGVSKLMGEAMGLVYADYHGLDFIALRVAAIYGFGMRFPLFIKPMIENAVRGLPTRLATGGPMRRDYTHVLDCSRAAALAVDLPPLAPGSQRVFNAAAGHVRSGREIAQVVRDVIPGADIEIGDRLTDLELANSRMRAPLDSTEAGRVLGWRPEWTIEDGVREYADRFRSFLEHYPIRSGSG